MKVFCQRSRVKMYFLVKSDLKLFLVVACTCRGRGLKEVIPGKRTSPQVGLEEARAIKT